MQFKDKVVIITGSSSGIGREIALQFAREGGNVIINGRNQQEVGSVVDEIQSSGGTALGFVADVSIKGQVENLVNYTIQNFDRVDILVNNAGGGGGSKNVEDLTEEDWDEVIAKNLKSVFFCSQAVLETMKKNKYGKIINISSQAGRALTILAGPHYASAKAGVIAFTRQLAKEVARSGINVNAVAPGIIYSGPRFGQVWDSYPEGEREQFLEDIAIGRLGTNREIAATVLFLASDGAGYLVGATLDVNGGRWML